MAIDSYMCFIDYNDKYLPSESQVDMKASNMDNKELANPFTAAFSNKGLFEVEDISSTSSRRWASAASRPARAPAR